MCWKDSALVFFHSNECSAVLWIRTWGINFCIQKPKPHTITKTKLSLYGLDDLAVSQRNSSAGTEIAASTPGHHSTAFTMSPSSSSNFLPHSLGSFQLQEQMRREFSGQSALSQLAFSWLLKYWFTTLIYLCNYFCTTQHPFFSSFVVWYISKEPTLCFNTWSISVRSFLGSAVMCVVMNVSRSPKTTTVVLQGTLLSRGKALPLPPPPRCHHCRYVLQSCEEPDQRSDPGWDLRLRLRPWSWNIKYIAIWSGCWKGEILQCFNFPLMAASIGCWFGPTTDQWWGQAGQNLFPDVCSVFAVTYPSVSCSLVWRKPSLCQEVYIPRTYIHATCMLCYLHSALLHHIEVCKFGGKCLSGSSLLRLICMTHREAKMQQPSGGAQGGFSTGTC